MIGRLSNRMFRAVEEFGRELEREGERAEAAKHPALGAPYGNLAQDRDDKSKGRECEFLDFDDCDAPVVGKWLGRRYCAKHLDEVMSRCE